METTKTVSASTVCPYRKCKLPKTNSQYGWHLSYMLIALFLLIKSDNSLTFVTVFMYGVPIFIDLWSSRLTGRCFRLAKKLLMAINIVIVLFCFFGFFGILVDEGKAFHVINTAIVFSDFSIKKDIVIFVLSVELVGPLIMWFGSPTKNTKSATTRVLGGKK